jgi:hypothetical protein
MPQTMFPQGNIQVEPQINQKLSTPLHKFVELQFFNDNKEWVELVEFTIETSDEKLTEILTDQESLEQWVDVRAREAVDNAGVSASSVGFGLALLGIGVAIAEISSGSYNSNASTAAFLASEGFMVAGAVEQENTVRSVDQALNNLQLSSKILLPPGQLLKRWFVINTPDDRLPAKFFIKYKASGRISGMSKFINLELTNEDSTLLNQLKPQKMKRPMKNDLWAKDL